MLHGWCAKVRVADRRSGSYQLRSSYRPVYERATSGRREEWVPARIKREGGEAAIRRMFDSLPIRMGDWGIIASKSSVW